MPGMQNHELHRHILRIEAPLVCGLCEPSRQERNTGGKPRQTCSWRDDGVCARLPVGCTTATIVRPSCVVEAFCRMAVPDLLLQACLSLGFLAAALEYWRIPSPAPAQFPRSIRPTATRRVHGSIRPSGVTWKTMTSQEPLRWWPAKAGLPLRGARHYGCGIEKANGQECSLLDRLHVQARYRRCHSHAH